MCHVLLHTVQRPVVLLPLLLGHHFRFYLRELVQYFLILHVDLIRLSQPDLTIERALTVLWKAVWPALGIEPLGTRSLPRENLVDLLE